MAREHDKATIGKLLGLKYPGEDLLDFVNTSLKKPARGASYGVLLPQDDQCEATICMSRSLQISCFYLFTIYYIIICIKSSILIS